MNYSGGLTASGKLPLRTEHAVQIRKLLVRTNLFKKKEQIITDFTDESKNHIAQLTADEAVAVTNYLQELDVRSQNMRRKMLSLGYEMHYDEPLSRAEEYMDRKQLNVRHVSAWCASDRCKYRKPLNSLDPFELSEVVTQFELVRDSFMKELSKKRNEQKK